MDTTAAPRSIDVTDPAGDRDLTPRGVPDAVGRLLGAGAVAGPLALLGATAAWAAGSAQLRGVLTTWAMAGLVLAFVAVARRAEGVTPVGAAVVLALGVAATAAGVGYALEMTVVDHFGIERLNDQATLGTWLQLRVPGLLIPLALAGAGVLLRRVGAIGALPAAAMIVGAIGFPLSRIPEIPAVAVVADGLLAIGLVPFGLRTLRGRG